jgi:RNA polymerase sigma-70 factor (ECF subfamily)
MQCRVIVRMSSDEELYGRIRAGDREALGELYERLEPALYRYALQLSGSRAVAEEAVHEAFLLLIGPRQHFDAGRGSLEAYLYGIVRNRIRVARRSEPVGDAFETAAKDDIAGALIAEETTAALYEAIRELPPAYRDAVVLCDLEERSYEDAATLMGCPVGTVRSRLYRARRLLGEKLSRDRLPAEGTAR